MDLLELVPPSNVQTTFGEIPKGRLAIVAVLVLASGLIWGAIMLVPSVNAFAVALSQTDDGATGTLAKIAIVVLCAIPIVAIFHSWRLYRTIVTNKIVPLVYLNVVNIERDMIHVKSYCGRTLAVPRSQVQDKRAAWDHLGYLEISGTTNKPKAELRDFYAER
ncbi:MAG: hypothetical protein V1902_03615 [Candidatus Falkowbacteria bacterium]